MNKEQTKMKKNLLTFLILIVMSIFLVACNSDSSSEEEIQIKITLYDEVNDSTIASDEFDAKEGQILQEVLEANYEVEVQQGGFITSIEGHQQNEADSIFWVYEVNGEEVHEAASNYELQENDDVLFKLMQFE